MIRIGIICPSEIAFRRFIPALKKCEEFSYCGVAVATDKEWFGKDYEAITEEHRIRVLESEMEKAKRFQKEYGGKIFYGYQEMISSEEIEALYLPLPPALHFLWAKKVLESGKHLFVEKPSTTASVNTRQLIDLAKKNNLAIHENYMFAFHNQLNAIKDVLNAGEVGAVRMFRIDFGFPRRSPGDFRYKKELGGGALLDCGGYTLKYAKMLLGSSAKIDYAKLNYTDEFDVDLYGSAALSNSKGQVVQISFGMDNAYKCTLEVWGSRGRLISERILTAPAGFVPSCTLITQEGSEERKLPADDTFQKSLQYFARCIREEATRLDSYERIQQQADLVEEFLEKAGK